MNKIINQINNFIEEYPRVCIVLGSGLDNFTKQLKNNKILKYDDISGFLKTKVKGHSGQFVYGYINNVPILCAQGRFHYYEGHTFEDIGIIIKLFNYYNPEKIIITNSSGCLRLDWGIGDFMLVEKFIDFSFINSNQPQEYIMDKSLDKNLNIHTGTYTYTIGPTYETKAEINEIINLGGDAVGMSTIMEVIAAKQAGFEIAGLSAITNKADGGPEQQPDTIDEGLEYASVAGKKIKSILPGLLQAWT